MKTYADYLREKIAENVLNVSDEELLSMIHAMIMEHVIQEMQPARS